MVNQKTFIKITNKDIYDKLSEVKEELFTIKEQVLKINGRVKLNRWIATTALALIVAVVFGMIGVKIL